MLRTKTVITKKNAKDVYQYFLQAIQKRRIFEDDLEKLTEAEQGLLWLAATQDANGSTADFGTGLQRWVDTYIPLDKWRRCLATLRQTRSNQKHGIKSIKLNKEAYTILKNYADSHNISLQQALEDAIKQLPQQNKFP